MNRYLREEHGLTLIEIVIIVIIVGIALPSLFVLMGNLSVQTFQNRLMTQSVNLANNRLEEIQAFKEANWDWYKTVNNYVETENIDGFTRTTEVSYDNAWGNSGYEAYQVVVSVTHPKFPDGYIISFYLTKYTK